jgi:hypothetical protein
MIRTSQMVLLLTQKNTELSNPLGVSIYSKSSGLGIR